MDDEVEYESSDSEPIKPKPIIKSSEINTSEINTSEINTYEIGNEYVFYNYDYANDKISDEPINLVLQKYNHITNFYFFKHPTGTILQMRGFDSFEYDKTIIWEDTNENCYICPQIGYDYIDYENYCQFFIEDLYYDFSVTRKEGITTSVKNARLLFDNKTLHDDLVVYIFIDEDIHKFYYFIINEDNEFKFYGKNSDAEIAVRNGICDSTSKIQDICMDDLDDDDEPSEEMESNEIAICISCGESFFKDEEEKVALKEPLVKEAYKKYWSEQKKRYYYVNQTTNQSVWEIPAPKPKPKEEFGFNHPPTKDQTLCFYCRITIAELNDSDTVYNPMEYPGYYDIKTLKKINLNGRSDPQPFIITMFFGLHGHGGIVNSKDKKGIQITTRGSEYAKSFTSGYEVALSTFQSKPSCRTHMVCIGNPLLFNIAESTHNGNTFNEEIYNLFQEKDANVNSVVKGIIKYETDYHNFPVNELKDIYLTPDNIDNYGIKTARLAYNNHLQMKDQTWGIATNFGLTRTAIAEKYITGYSSITEREDRRKNNIIMDPAVDVRKPIVRALYCNISYPGLNSNTIIDVVIPLTNNITLSAISTICENYLIDFYKKKFDEKKMSDMYGNVELVSIIIDKSCNYSTSDVVFPHIAMSPRIVGLPYNKKYNAWGKRKQSTHKRKQNKQKRKQTKQKRKQSKQKQSKQSKR